MPAKIKIRRGTSSQWASSTNILDQGELGYDISTKLIKIGDGSSLWASLQPVNKFEIQELAQDAIYEALTNFVATGQNITATYNDSSNTMTLDTGTNVVLITNLNTAISTEVSNRNTAIATAKSEAISASATDATTKATAAQSAASTDATTKVAAEATLRVSGDAASVTTAATDATTKVAAEATLRVSGDAASVTTAATDATTKVAAEATLRVSGDAASVTTAATDATTKVAAEATLRVSGDAASVSTAATDATTKVAAEAALRVSGDAASVSTAAADATTKAGAALISANSYTDTAVSSLGNTAATTYVLLSDVGNIDGVASLDGTGKIPDTEIPAGIARDAEVTTAISTAINTLINSAPGTLDTLGEIATAMSASDSAAAALVTAVNLKAPIASPTFTGTVGGITKDMVGLANANNTTDANKPISTATQTALDLKLNLAEPSVDYYISNSGTGGYLVNGVLNGTIDFVKGKKYRIIVNAIGHPFWIQTSYGAYTLADVYSTGITNAGTDNGSILVELPQSAPDNLYYACEYHSTMKGAINSRASELLDYGTSSSATTYTLTSANSSKTTEFTAATDVTITIPTDPSNTTWPIGSSLELRQMGAGRLIFAVTSPATIVSTDGYLKTRTQYSSAFLEKRASNAWILTGDIDA